MAIDFRDRDEERPERATSRPWIGILFECCGVYARLYRRAEQSEYVGRCPKCFGEVRVEVGPGGTRQRIFRAI